MAHIETVQTGFRVETHIRGRVYRNEPGKGSQGPNQRPAQTLQSRMRPAAKQRRRVCLLSARDARWLRDHGISQPCFGPGCTHSHHTRARIEMLVKSGDLEWIGESKNVACWPDPREYKGARSGPVKTMQLVPVGSGQSALERRELYKASLVVAG